MNNEKNLIRILKIEPGKTPYVKEISNDLEGSQAEVQGLIDCIRLEDRSIAVINDEGKINGMEPNRRYRNDIICGPFFICGSSEDEFTSLTDEQIEKFSMQFGDIPEFTGKEPELEPRITFMTF